MSWPLRLIEPPRYVNPASPDHPDVGESVQRTRLYEVGDCWLASKNDAGEWYLWPDGEWRQPLKGFYTLSPEYHRDNAHRPPVVVVLPGKCIFVVDACTYADGGPGPHGWKVTGTPPRLTVAPSINVSGTYHGWLRDGVLTDDCEGRRYDERGHVAGRTP